MSAIAKVVFSRGQATIDPKRAQDSGNIAKGNSLADMFFKEIQAQGTTMLRTLAALVNLNQAGREAFRVNLTNKRAEARAFAKGDGFVAVAGMGQVAKRCNASAFVRISEMIVVSRAIDAGWSPDLECGYHWNVSEARAMLESESATGPTAKRGRKALTKVQKAVAYLDKLGLTAKDKEALASALSA